MNSCKACPYEPRFDAAVRTIDIQPDGKPVVSPRNDFHGFFPPFLNHYPATG